MSRGNSNGGTLVAVTALQAPDAFRAVFCRAPTLDMIRFTRFDNLRPATVEFGSPDDPLEGAYLAAYSPYHNVRPGIRYPAIAFVPAMNDKVSPPYDPVKMVARMQAEATDGGPYLLLPLRDSGHGGGTTFSVLIEQGVDELCFYAVNMILSHTLWPDVESEEPAPFWRRTRAASRKRERRSTLRLVGQSVTAGRARSSCSGTTSPAAMST